MIDNTMREYAITAEQLPGCILIVDDDQEILDALKDLLMMEGGYKVETATSVLSAKHKLNYFKPDIAILDIRLGTSNGLDLASFLKSESPDIDCIMMTAYREVDFAIEALRCRADDYLFKPIDPARLLQSMDDFFHRRQIRQEKSSKERNNITILEQTSGFIFLLSPAGLCIEASHAALSYIDQGRDEITGRPFWEMPLWQRSNVDSKQLQELIYTVSSGQMPRLEVEIADRKGHKSWFEFSLKPVFEKGNHISLIIVEGHDLTEQKHIEKKLIKMALHDPLTGLANRTLLYEHLNNTLAHAAISNQQFSVIYIDLDHFKVINDSLGHQAGDELLIKIARCLEICMREEDIVARIGGDEFVIVLGSESDRAGTRHAVERLMRSIVEPSLMEGYGDVVSASIGIAVFPNDGMDADTLLRNADTAMYKAKKKGKNCFQYYSSQ